MMFQGTSINGARLIEPERWSDDRGFLARVYCEGEKERGIRWNDSRFSIECPAEPTDVCARDTAWPDSDPEHHVGKRLRGTK